jgi:RluA family pseudouridine synthase
MEEIRRGLIQVDRRMIDFTTLFSSHVCMQHRIHRHEPPVTADPIDILHKDDSIVVIDKPSSIPVHPTGRYRHNTVTFILAREHGLRNLYPVHRLDKLTSGLLLFARNPQRAEQIASEIRESTVQKTYLARVSGSFPIGKLVCKEPILLAADIGLRDLNKVHPDGKPCETHFERLFFDGKESVVKCQPKTGRTHQIRVHLAHLGHPIVNDPLYNPEYRALNAEPWELEMAGEGEDEAVGNNVSGTFTPTGPSDPTQATSSTENDQEDGLKANEIHSISNPVDPEKLAAGIAKYLEEHKWMPNVPPINIDEADPQPLCELCKVSWRRPEPHQLRIYLHALSYKGTGFHFETKTPLWALPTFNFTQEENSTTPMVVDSNTSALETAITIPQEDSFATASLSLVETEAASSCPTESQNNQK